MSMATFHTVRAESVAATVVMTKRVELEGISLNGLMMQKILRDTSKNASQVDTGDIATAITQLQTAANALSEQVMQLNETVTNVADSQDAVVQSVNALTDQVAGLVETVQATADIVTENNAFIQTLKLTTYFVEPPP